MYTTDHYRTDEKDEEKIMGTASLVFGVIMIIIGGGFGVYWLMWMPFGVQEFGIFITVIVGLIVTVPMFVIGGLLLRKFDKDRKKNGNS